MTKFYLRAHDSQNIFGIDSPVTNYTKIYICDVCSQIYENDDSIKVLYCPICHHSINVCSHCQMPEHGCVWCLI